MNKGFSRYDRRTMRNSARLALFLVALGLVGCGSLGSLLDGGAIFGGRGLLDATIASDLNGDAPVALDVVVVYDEAMQNKLVTLGAEAWFDGKKKLIEDFPGTLVVALHHEWVPGTPRQTTRYEYGSGALATIVFALYDSPGDHRLVFPPGGPVTLRLETWEVVRRESLP